MFLSPRFLSLVLWIRAVQKISISNYSLGGQIVKILSIGDRRIPSASIGLHRQQLVGGREERRKVRYFTVSWIKFSVLLEKGKSQEAQVPHCHLIACTFC